MRGGAGGSDKPARRRFAPPTVEEVRAYCAEINAGIDPAYFVDHYAANGWRVGKAPMKDWRAAARIRAEAKALRDATNGRDQNAIVRDSLTSFGHAGGGGGRGATRSTDAPARRNPLV